MLEFGMALNTRLKNEILVPFFKVPKAVIACIEAGVIPSFRKPGYFESVPGFLPRVPIRIETGRSNAENLLVTTEIAEKIF
jgi:hypothetical protein